MKIGICINTPAQWHFWKNIIKNLMSRGHEIKILVRKYRETLDVIDKSISKTTYSFNAHSKYGKIFASIFNVLWAYRTFKKFNPDIILDACIYRSCISLLLKKPYVVFTDSEPRSSKVLAFQCKFFTPMIDVIITPKCFLDDLGKKHLRVDSFKELAYLHPKYFKPDKGVLEEMGVEENSYAVVRFNAFDAAHDIGIEGFSNEEKIKLVKELEKYVDVFISAEGEIPKELRNYVLPVSKRKIHHVLYYARVLISETGTMSSEAAILGTPVVMFHPKTFKFGVFAELEKKYDALYRYTNSIPVIKKAIELASNSNIKKEWKKKREKIIKEKVDITEFMTWFIENYPESFEEFKANPEMRYRFK